MSIAVRTNVDPLGAVNSLRRELRGAGADQVLYEVRSMEQLAGATLDQQRFLMLVFGIFASLALLLASIGIYGVLAYVTNQRVPEIGVRMALGAGARDVMRLVFGQSLRMIFAGAAFGRRRRLCRRPHLGAARRRRPRRRPADFRCDDCRADPCCPVRELDPARRASRVDPLSALRQQ